MNNAFMRAVRKSAPLTTAGMLLAGSAMLSPAQAVHLKTLGAAEQSPGQPICRLWVDDTTSEPVTKDGATILENAQCGVYAELPNTKFYKTKRGRDNNSIVVISQTYGICPLRQVGATMVHDGPCRRADKQ